MADEAISKEFQRGFQFALIVFKSMGVAVDLDALEGHLASVARGDLTLVPTPEEVIQEQESQAGKPMPAELTDVVRRLLAGRAEKDAWNRQAAASILEMMGATAEADDLEN